MGVSYMYALRGKGGRRLMCVVIFGVTTCNHAIYNTPVFMHVMSLVISFYSYSIQATKPIESSTAPAVQL